MDAHGFRWGRSHIRSAALPLTQGPPSPDRPCWLHSSSHRKSQPWFAAQGCHLTVKDLHMSMESWPELQFHGRNITLVIIFPNSSQLKPKKDFIALTTKYSLYRYSFRRNMLQVVSGALDYLSQAMKENWVLLPREESMVLRCPRITDVHFS